MQVVDPRRSNRQETYDLRDHIIADDHSQLHAHAEATLYASTDDEEHSVLEDDSEGEEHEADYMEEDDDASSSLSIPNESIDFDLVYSLHSFAATVEGQANVVKGDSLFLMDDSNSYWWLVRVLKTQEVGYIPAENIETPFERLARLNKHRNVDLASATQAEMQENINATRDRIRERSAGPTPSPIPGGNGGDPRQINRSNRTKSVLFTPTLSVHRYPPAVWNEEEEKEEEDVEWDEEGYEDEDPGLADEQMQQRRAEEGGPTITVLDDMEPDDEMRWDDSAAKDLQARQAGLGVRSIQNGAPLRTGPTAEQQQQEALLAQKQQLREQQEQARQREYEQRLVEQQLQQEKQAQKAVQQAQTTQPVLRQSNSRERLIAAQIRPATSPASIQIDPAQVTETRKVTVTPTIAREDPSTNVLPPSAILQKQEEERKRAREEEASDESAKKKAKGKDRMPAPVSSAGLAKPNNTGSGKLRKERAEEDESKDKKKKGSVFGGFFGRKKDKEKGKNASIGSLDTADLGRTSEESSRSSNNRPSVTNVDATVSPMTATAIQQQQQQTFSLRSNSIDSKRAPEHQEPPVTPPQVSAHASQLRQRDQQQQYLYQQQYLNRSPSSLPEAHPISLGVPPPSSFHGTPTSNTGLGPPTSRPRPGSLILTPSSVDGQGVGVPDLSVIRVFAGKNLQTEATFKTVLLNTSTTSSDLVKQAIQRFRLPTGEDANDYYLTVKQVEGSSAVLRPSENPLRVFETLVEAAMELPKVKRSSVGSISSVVSNLSMHPAIKKLSMNDFTDDSAVKFYLNRKGEDGTEESLNDIDETLPADTSHGESDSLGSPKSPFLAEVNPERFSSPSFRFALQLIIYPDDLPDDMIFDPLTEAIVFKNTPRDRSLNSTTPSSGISQNFRRKIFVFPKNVTVAEVIELGLERFGISEGVVDGGDEVEDKLTKRRSMARVRYGLTVDTGKQTERELSPSSKVIDAYLRPPTLRTAPPRQSDSKRRSVDSAQLLGSVDDVSPDDPVFILRRAISYRNSTSRHRTSAPLDEIALQNLHRESASSSGSDPAAAHGDDKQKQPSRQDIIAAQRAATRANQRAILSAQTNSLRGVDVLLPGHAMIRSSRYDSGDVFRYSYVEPDGETYDISDIVEKEWRENNPANRNDLLEGVLARSKDKDGLGEKLDRVLSKIKVGKPNSAVSFSSGSSQRSSLRSASEYSLDDVSGAEGGSRSVTPVSAIPAAANNTRAISPPDPPSRSISPPDAVDKPPRPGTTTPTARPGTAASSGASGSRRQPSIASVMSDLSGYATPTGQLNLPSSIEEDAAYSAPTPQPQRKKTYIPKDDFGLSHMMALIESGGMTQKAPLPYLDPVEEMLFGRTIDLGTLHPQIRSIYQGAFKQLSDMDKALDDYLMHTIRGL